MAKAQKVEIPHCATCGNQAGIDPAARACHLCGGPIVIGDPWVTEFRKQLRGTRALVQVAKEDDGSATP